MTMRSLLFVPGDRPERFDKAANSGADVIILDLEDSVSLANKPIARDAVSAYLTKRHAIPTFVRINPLDGDLVKGDILAIASNPPDGIVLPKAEGPESIRQLQSLLGQQKIPILPIASETPTAVFQLGGFREVRDALIGLTWGAEDLPAAIGAAASRNPDGSYTGPYEMVRALALFGAHAAGVAAIDTVFPDIKNLDGLAKYSQAGARDGFTGMMAIHPAQIEIINAAFTPSAADIAWSQSILDVFANNPGAGVLELEGKMIDKPHLDQARKIIEKAGL